MEAEAIINDYVSSEDLKKYEQLYLSQEKRGVIHESTYFDYALCLIRSRYSNDIRKGIVFLLDILKKTNDDQSRRDYLYYLAVGYTKLKEYEEALQYIKRVLELQSDNRQAISMEQFIKKKLTKEGLMGMAIIGGAVLTIGSLVGLGVALAKK
ncbi:mitochondrial fission 1 protein-like [Argonauta hians]